MTIMTILEHPQAQELLAAATLTHEAVGACASRLTAFLARYLPLFARSEQRAHAATVIQGKLSGLERKTSEPVATQAGIPRKPIQSFVGWGAWDDEAVTAEIRAHVRREWAGPDGVLVIDPSSFPKKGTESRGVQRQWCGRLGKVENCQLGVFLFYACARGHAPLDRRLFLPKEWADDPDRRGKTHVPREVAYQERWQIALDMIRRAKGLPHRWVAAASEFGAVAERQAVGSVAAGRALAAVHRARRGEGPVAGGRGDGAGADDAGRPGRPRGEAGGDALGGGSF